MSKGATRVVLICFTLFLALYSLTTGVFDDLFSLQFLFSTFRQLLASQNLVVNLKKDFSLVPRNAFLHFPDYRDRLVRFDVFSPGSYRRLATKASENVLNKLRRDFYLRHGILYGCPEDPTMMEVYKNQLPVLKLPIAVEQSLKNQALRERLTDEANLGKPRRHDKNRGNPSLSSPSLGRLDEKEGPPRLALLFLTRQESLLHPEIWVSWLAEARRFSHYFYTSRKGPYRGVDALRPFTPLYSLHIHVSQSKPKRYISLHEYGLVFFSSVFRVLKTIIIFVLRLLRLCSPSSKIDSQWQFSRNWWEFLKKKDGETHWNAVLDELGAAKVFPSVNCRWGNVNPCQYELLRRALQDTTTSWFIFISESTVPVKPFSYIYQQYLKNPTSRFHFSNLNLPLVKKHHQWIILNRYHARLLVEHPEKWRCASWLKHWYRHNIFLPSYAAPDEYLPFYALSETVGFKRIWNEINNKQVTQNLYNYSNTFVEKDASHQFRHTWVCWQFFEESVETQSCTRMGKFFFTLGSPVNYYQVNDTEAIHSLIAEPNVWFARKFHPNCMVTTDKHVVSLSKWLSHQMEKFYINYSYLNVTSFS